MIPAFPNCQAAGVEHTMLHLFSLPVTAEVSSAWKCSNDTAKTQLVLGGETECLGLVWVGVRVLRCPLHWPGSAGMWMEGS